ncbi:15881_t:CDS:2 [Racocetra fulgida]|uniref:15881_t:CDS:1 n=1 Tax=Racocetra fulgida TaxID=60492 RepID=A0A9N8VT91_9GLOM|nr:15881_t:CDS:2 [Racocetra fulgida]
MQKTFQLRSGVSQKGVSGRKTNYELNTIVEFYCFNCQTAEGEEGGGGDDIPPQIQTKSENNKADLIENDSGEEGEEINELNETSEKNKGKLLEKIIQLQKEMISLLEKALEEKKEKRKLLKENSDQQESKNLEEEINKLEKELIQKRQELEELERQYTIEKK